MSKLWYNPTTKVVFGSDDTQDASIQSITADQIPDLIANGATVDSSANYTGNTQAPAATSTSGTGADSAASSTASSTASTNNPTTEDTVIPTTTTPVSMVGTSSGSDSLESAASPSVSPSAGSSAVSSADAPNVDASAAASPSAASTSVSAPVVSGASVVAESPDDLAAKHPGTTPAVSYSETPGSGDPEKDNAMLENSTAIVGAGNMHLNADKTDATGTTGTVAGQPVLSNATAGYTATLTPPVTDPGATSDHPAHGLLSRLWKSLEGNSMAGEARELIIKIRDLL